MYFALRRGGLPSSLLALKVLVPHIRNLLICLAQINSVYSSIYATNGANAGAHLALPVDRS